ncbi:DAP3-binding cell death enhancer 1-like [Topomyia yanbarensis]|uniref:DAP3-binding cell death enhancer 1-like n=1 Tax=Topomyia yanbarensis TaxID=2498891 RepID=UPI00273B1C65|nr:DAP3-binding cell death enhancer 1-like [Topomyia yanbarensis]
MWKYVSRRIRDVCDRTYNVLDVRRPCQYGGERFCVENNYSAADSQQQQKHPQQDNECNINLRNELIKGSYCLLNVGKRHVVVYPNRAHNYDTGSNSSDREGFSRKEYCSFQRSWIGAITWSSAIICGWYTSQLICLYRRNHNWEGPKCLPFIISSTHRIPCKYRNSHSQNAYPFSAPPSPPIERASKQDQLSSQQVTFFGVPIPSGKPSKLEEFDFENFSETKKKFLSPVNNEKLEQTKISSTANERPVVQKVESKSPTVESAVENLLSVIGEIEYQLGVQNLEIGDYNTAVSHLKLGTSHQHSGAAFNLGICYEQGFGVKKSARMAMECYHLASTLGHPQAMYNLGVYYARGLGGLRRSRQMARKYFTAAADLGLKEAIDVLGSKYQARRDSVWSGAGSSASSSPTVAPFEFKFNYDDLGQYGFGKSGLRTTEQLDQVELRLVSAMA